MAEERTAVVHLTAREIRYLREAVNRQLHAKQLAERDLDRSAMTKLTQALERLTAA